MSDQPVLAIDPQRLESLRNRAASLLTGPAASKGPAPRAADALAVLHALASSPQTAPDALKLLHELQVHQVELDLQAQELQESRAELESALRRQTELYDHQPVGCYTVDARMVMLELNQTGAELLGIGRDEAYGRPLDACFSADSARRLVEAVVACDAGTRRSAGLLMLSPLGQPLRQVLASVGADPAAHPGTYPGERRYLVSLTPTGDDPAPAPAAA